MFQKIKYLLLCISGYCMAQGGFLNNSAAIYNNAASIWIATNGSGHYTSNGTGRITPWGAAAAMYVYGNWTNNASNTGFTADTGTVYMDGTNVNIGGTSPTTFYNLTLRNAGVKTMTRNIAVGGMSTLTGVLNLQNCELNLNQYTLTITNPNMTIGRTTGYINSENGCGTCNVWSSAVTWSIGTNTGARTIPFGVNGTYIPMTLTKINAVSTNITVSTRSAVANNSGIPTNVTQMNVPAMSVTQTNDGTNTVIDRWWYITPSTPSTSPVSLDLNVTYRGTENTCTGCPQTGNFGAQYWVNYSATNYGWKPCAGPSWTCSTMGTWPGVIVGTQGATASTGAVSLPDGNLQTSYWVLSCAAKPLPIELASFNALCQKNATALLQWKTATEVNALKFEIEKSTNGVDFVSIASVPAQYPLGGDYTYVDNTKTTGIAYYRLKMIDKDGSFKYSGMADVNFGKCNNLRTQIYGYDKNIVINVQTENNQNIRAVVFDVLGRILTDKLLEVHTGANTFQLPVEVTQSIYFVKLIDERGEIIQTQKVLLGE